MSEKTAIETGIENLEKRFTKWLRLFEGEHKARVLNIEVNRDRNDNLHDIKLLVRPIPKKAAGNTGVTEDKL